MINGGGLLSSPLTLPPPARTSTRSFPAQHERALTLFLLCPRPRAAAGKHLFRIIFRRPDIARLNYCLSTRRNASDTRYDAKLKKKMPPNRSEPVPEAYLLERGRKYYFKINRSLIFTICFFIVMAQIKNIILFCVCIALLYHIHILIPTNLQ